MANNKKRWYYILVFTGEGPKYVTSIGEGKTAFWDKDKKPREFSKTSAEDIVFGLCVNFYNAVVVESLYEIPCQPYLYNKYSIKWEEIKEEDIEEAE